ncbi:MAG: 4a-hydroxytetrahydrobiopterin dehydratase [Acidobacteria bacterium]|nr:MAG: 4a-hydroxytetrahydrobiopterin dehydratase [Acidobacteriota bacterium]PYQ23721.1 MAG: 4a-hydroxytetrahydrobiopterin dehydratase [Acidobacteriota bacterium]
MGLLSEARIGEQMRQLAGWERSGAAIRKTYRFGSFKEGVAFANRVAEQAEEQDHHPDILIQYRQVTLTLTSHDAGGLTERDFRLARRIDG